MMSFLKNFFAGEKSAEEKALLSMQAAEKHHDVLTVDGCATEKGGCSEESEEEVENFSGPCCGGGCRS